MIRTLVIGYGNLDRQDDGVAHAIVGGLPKSCGIGWCRHAGYRFGHALENKSAPKRIAG